MYTRRMNTQEEPTKSFSIRIPVEMLDALRKVAKQHNRSIHGEILTAIREHINKSQKEDPNRDQGRTDHTTEEETHAQAKECEAAVQVLQVPFVSNQEANRNLGIDALARYQEQQPSGAGSVPRKPGRVRSASGTA